VKSCLSKRAALSITLSLVSTNKGKKVEKKKNNDQDIVQSLKKYNKEVNGRGETLPEQQKVFHVKVVKTFLQTSASLGKVDQFSALFEETG